jgi:hypothetical protein
LIAHRPELERLIGCCGQAQRAPAVAATVSRSGQVSSPEPGDRRVRRAGADAVCTIASTAGGQGNDAGLAGALINSARQIGGATGPAVVASVAASFTHAAHGPAAINDGFQGALTAPASCRFQIRQRLDPATVAFGESEVAVGPGRVMQREQVGRAVVGGITRRELQ